VLITHSRLSNEKRMDSEIQDTLYSRPNRPSLEILPTKLEKNLFLNANKIVMFHYISKNVFSNSSLLIEFCYQIIKNEFNFT